MVGVCGAGVCVLDEQLVGGREGGRAVAMDALMSKDAWRSGLAGVNRCFLCYFSKRWSL